MDQALLLQDGDAVFRRGLEAFERSRVDLVTKRGHTPTVV